MSAPYSVTNSAASAATLKKAPLPVVAAASSNKENTGVLSIQKCPISGDKEQLFRNGHCVGKCCRGDNSSTPRAIIPIAGTTMLDVTVPADFKLGLEVAHQGMVRKVAVFSQDVFWSRIKLSTSTDITWPTWT